MSKYTSINIPRSLQPQPLQPSFELHGKEQPAKKINETKRAGSGKIAAIAKMAFTGLVFAGIYYSVNQRFSQQAKSLDDMKAACQKNYEGRIQQCTTFQQWCSTRTTPRNMKDLPSNYPAYASELDGLHSNHPGATLDQKFLDSSPMIACLNYKAFVNTENPELAKDSGIKLHESIHPHVENQGTVEQLREHCIQTISNYCPA